MGGHIYYEINSVVGLNTGTYMCVYTFIAIPYKGLFSQGANFHECYTSGLSRNFHDSKIHNPELT